MSIDEIVSDATYRGKAGRLRTVVGFMTAGNVAHAETGSVVLYKVKGSTKVHKLWTVEFAAWAQARVEGSAS